MKKLFIVYWILFIVLSQTAYSQNAPLITAGTVVSSGTTAIVPITVTNFININSFAVQLNYNPAIVHATLVTKDSILGGSFNTNLNNSGIIIIGWYAYPADTVPDNSIIFKITFTKVTDGTSPLIWFDNGSSCYYRNGNYVILNDLPTASYYFNGSVSFGVIPLAADFTASTTTPAKNTTVQFTDLTTGGPTSWAWSFSRPTYVNFVNGTTASSQNPQVQFTDGGLYTVTLVATNGSGSNTKVKTDYIRAGIAGLWAGVTSTEWATTTNWDNWLVPVSSTDVTIPSSASFWPVYTGDFILGTVCKSITMNGASMATVSGNSMISPGASLNIVNNATFKVGGNWTNAGIFSAGTGTVEFISASPSSIINGGSPPVMNNFYNLTVSKLNVSLTILPDITVNGNVTINP